MPLSQLRARVCVCTHVRVRVRVVWDLLFFPTMESQVNLEPTGVCMLSPHLGFLTVSGVPSGPSRSKETDTSSQDREPRCTHGPSYPLVSQSTKIGGKLETAQMPGSDNRSQAGEGGGGARRGGTQGKRETKENQPLKVKAVGKT